MTVQYIYYWNVSTYSDSAVSSETMLSINGGLCIKYFQLLIVTLLTSFSHV